MNQSSGMNRPSGVKHGACREEEERGVGLFERDATCVDEECVGETGVGASGSDDLAEFLDEQEDDASSAPRLKLHHGDEVIDEQIESDETVGREDAFESAEEDENDAWPWDHDLEDATARGETSREELAKTSDAAEVDEEDESAMADELRKVRVDENAPSPAAAQEKDGAFVEDDHSAIEDVVLSMPIVQTPIEETLSHFVSQMDHEAEALGRTEAVEESCGPESEEQVEGATIQQETPSEASTTEEPYPDSPLGNGREWEARPAAAPKKIGSGQLVPARLTWRPGDPFGEAGVSAHRFRWDVMLTSAGITAACGIFCVWLLRTLLA